MGVLLAGDAGSVILGRGSASALALEGLAGRVGPAYPPDALPEDLAVDRVELVSGESATREAIARWAASRELPVVERRIEPLQPPQGLRVLTVESVTTGSGKSAVTLKLARSLVRSGVRTVVVRHPMASALDAPAAERVQDLDGRPLDIREELEPLQAAGIPVICGTDAPSMLDAAADVARVVVWDGGGSAEPWIQPDIRVLVVDLLRPLHERDQPRVAAADVVVLTKADSAPEERARATEARVREWNPIARAFLADMPVAVPESPRLVDRHVVIVEDWPSLLLGGLKAGAGAVAARRFRCGVVDPRPYAVGAVACALGDHPQVGAVIPSLGRTPGELDDLRRSIAATPGEVVLWASPASPDGIVDRPLVRVYPELIETAGGSLQDVIRPLLPGESGHVPTIRRR